MNYIVWNNIVGRYLFDPSQSGKEVFLYVSKNIIIESFRRSSHFEPFKQTAVEGSEIGEVATDTEVDQHIWEDYCRALRLGARQYNGLNSWFGKVEDTWRLWTEHGSGKIYGINVEYPLFLGYLVALVLPLAENEDDFSAGNYYDRVIHFFQQNAFLTRQEVGELGANYESFKTSFSNSFRKIEYCWEALATWSRQNNGSLGIFNVKRVGAFSYVGKPFAECIITRYQRQLVPLLFERSNLRVGESLPRQVFETILGKSGQQVLRYPESKWRVIMQDRALLELLINVIAEAYEAWTGTFRTLKDDPTGFQPSFAIINIYLSITISEPGESLTNISFRFFQPTIENDFDDLTLVFEDNNVSNLSFYQHGWARAKTALPRNLPEVLEESVIYKDSLNHVKAVHSPSSVFLLSSHPALDSFVSKSELTHKGSYYLLCKNTLARRVEKWLTTCEKSTDLTFFDGVPQGWRFYKFTHATESCEGISVLTLPATCKIQEVRGMHLEGTTYLNFVPLKFSIVGLAPNESIEAIADYDSKQILTEGIDGLYTLPGDTFDSWANIRLETTGGQILGSGYKFSDWQFPSCWDESSIDDLGFTNENGVKDAVMKGLIFLKKGKKYQVALSQLYDCKLIDVTSALPKVGSYIFDDILLYTISCKSKFDIDWFSHAFRNSAETNTSTLFNRKDIKRALDCYHQLGFLNYDFNKERRRHSITVNRPTFLNMPMQVAASSQYQVLLTGARTPAFMRNLIEYCKKDKSVYLDFSQSHDQRLVYKFQLPRPVFLNARDKRAFVNVAAALNISYQPEIYYPISLVEHAPSIQEFDAIFAQLALKDWADFAVTKDYFMPGELRSERTTKEVDTTLSLVEYQPGTYQAKCVLWENGQAFEVDKAWGKYYLLYKSGISNAIHFRTATSELFVPANLRLPKVFARAFCLMTGIAPMDVVENGRFYQVYRLPQQLEWNILYYKLKQRKHI